MRARPGLGRVTAMRLDRHPPGRLRAAPEGTRRGGGRACQTGPMSKPQTVDAYLEALTEQGRDLLEQVRALARETVPEASEAVKWGHPAWVHPSGTILFVFNGHARHANVVFTPSTREAFGDELAGFTTGKGSVRLPYGQPVPGGLLGRMMAFRVREHEDDGVLWM